MCGRFSLATTPEAVENTIAGIHVPESLPLRYNIAPSQMTYVVSALDPHSLRLMQWGLIPHWARDPRGSKPPINARMETIFDKPTFRESILRRRCLVLMDSFYEWGIAGGRKQPYRIQPHKGGLLTAAGIWDQWGTGDQRIESFCIITTPANREVSAVHDRMPLFMLSHEEQNQWLSPLPTEEIHMMLHPAPDGILDLYPVSEKVNKVANDGPDLHESASGPGSGV